MTKRKLNGRGTNRKPNYELKSEVLKSGICAKVKKLHREFAKGNFSKEVFDKVDSLKLQYGLMYYDEAIRINNASYQRSKRLKTKVIDIISLGQCVWLTLTFNDDVLASTKETTRRQYVRKCLKTVSTHYIANIDYGGQYDREHYHAIVLGNLHRSDFVWWEQRCGFTFIENVRVNQESIDKLPHYINKLCNHAIKESTKRNYVIYSRC